MYIDTREIVSIAVKYMAYTSFCLVNLLLPIVFLIGIYTIIIDEIVWFPKLLKVFVGMLPITFTLMYIHQRLDPFE